MPTVIKVLYVQAGLIGPTGVIAQLPVMAEFNHVIANVWTVHLMIASEPDLPLTNNDVTKIHVPTDLFTGKDTMV